MDPKNTAVIVAAVLAALEGSKKAKPAQASEPQSVYIPVDKDLVKANSAILTQLGDKPFTAVYTKADGTSKAKRLKVAELKGDFARVFSLDEKNAEKGYPYKIRVDRLKNIVVA